MAANHVLRQILLKKRSQKPLKSSICQFFEIPQNRKIEVGFRSVCCLLIFTQTFYSYFLSICYRLHVSHSFRMHSHDAVTVIPVAKNEPFFLEFRSKKNIKKTSKNIKKHQKNVKKTSKNIKFRVSRSKIDAIIRHFQSFFSWKLTKPDWFLSHNLAKMPIYLHPIV